MTEVTLVRCNKCEEVLTRNDAIQKNLLSAGRFLYHKNHFGCSMCEVNLGTSFFFISKREGNVLCCDCFYAKFHPNCDGCKKPIMESYCELNDRIFHKDCIKCVACNNTLIEGNYVVMEGEIYDEDCYYVKKYHLEKNKE